MKTFLALQANTIFSSVNLQTSRKWRVSNANCKELSLDIVLPCQKIKNKKIKSNIFGHAIYYLVLSISHFRILLFRTIQYLRHFYRKYFINPFTQSARLVTGYYRHVQKNSFYGNTKTGLINTHFSYLYQYLHWSTSLLKLITRLIF